MLLRKRFAPPVGIRADLPTTCDTGPPCVAAFHGAAIRCDKIEKVGPRDDLRRVPHYAPGLSFEASPPVAGG